MPAIYAHRAFGEDVKRLLPPAHFPEIHAHPDCFRQGLHGPDTLFYFHPLGKNAVNGRGYAMHDLPASPFFTEAAGTLHARGDLAADRAYLYGFVCHFALDSVCHPEVAAHLSPTHDAASAVAAYCHVTQRQALACIRSMIRSSRLLRAPNAFRRALLHAALRLAGSRSVIDMILPAADLPVHADGNAALAACYERALGKAASLLENYRLFLAGEAPLDTRFDSDYASEERK